MNKSLLLLFVIAAVSLLLVYVPIMIYEFSIQPEDVQDEGPKIIENTDLPEDSPKDPPPRLCPWENATYPC